MIEVSYSAPTMLPEAIRLLPKQPCRQPTISAAAPTR